MIEETTGNKERKPLLLVRNRHIADSGDPPELQLDSDAFITFFMNGYGEQWVLLGFNDDRIEVRGGDLGWEVVRETTLQNPYPDDWAFLFSEQELPAYLAFVSAFSRYQGCRIGFTELLAKAIEVNHKAIEKAKENLDT